MPRVSAFLGIVIWMRYEATAQHHAPHIHAEYAEYRASIAIETGEVLAGAMPLKQLRRVRGWIEAHRDALVENWNRALNYEALEWVGYP